MVPVSTPTTYLLLVADMREAELKKFLGGRLSLVTILEIDSSRGFT